MHISEGQEVWLVNNLITGNGTKPVSPTKDGFGVERRAAKPPDPVDSTVLLSNLICGNSTGELKGPVLVGTDAGNLTPTGIEGPGVSASPGCENPALVYANLAGPDGQLNTTDDDFTLAAGSPAIDRGVDLRTFDFGVPPSVVEADYFAEAARPQDGNTSGTAEFDLGAVERGQSGCTPGTTQPCYDGPAGTKAIGLCRQGTQTCEADGRFGVCQDQVVPGTETCNGADDDCDGQTDEGFEQTTCGVGACQRTVNACLNGEPQVCTPGTPGTEVCGNGTDEDCTGADLPCVANQPPQIISTPVLTATVGQSYGYDANAIDPNGGDVLTFSLTTAPAGMTIDATTGLIQWTPAGGQAGDNPVTVRVQDQGGLFATQSFTITVLIPNHAPSITSPPVTTAAEDQPYTYDVEATDPDTDDTLTFSLTVAPFGMSINANTGVIQWTPEQVQAGEQAVTVQVRDEGGLFSRQSFSVQVAEANRAPTAVDDSYEAEMGKTLTVPARGILTNDTDPNQNNSLTAALVSGPANGDLSLNPDGSFDYTPKDAFEPNPVVGNLTRLIPGVTASASSAASSTPAQAIDDNIASPWFAGSGDAANLGGAPFLEILFPVDVTVTELQMFGHRQFAGFDIFAGIFRLFDAGGMVLFDSGVVDLPAPDRDATVAIPDVAGVRRVRFTATADEGNNPGFAELRVIGPTLVPLLPELEWSWTGSTVLPDFKQVISTPIVANLTDDNQDGDINQNDIPDVIFATTNRLDGSLCQANAGVIRAVSGADGSSLFDVTDTALRITPCSPVAVGDLDGDGRPEIVGYQLGDRLVILNADGSLERLSETLANNRLGLAVGTSPSIADLDGDGSPEIVIGATVFDATGHILFSHVDPGNFGFGALSTTADLDLDGDLEVVGGFEAYRSDGSTFYDSPLGSSTSGGYPGIGNFDDDPFAEVVVVANGHVYLLEHDGTLKWGPKAIPFGGQGGPPTVADFDGDGEPEIGVAGFSRYVVFETNGDVKWQAPVQDGSSNIMGSSVFDFDNDGQAEVIYNDEIKLRIYRGSTGELLFETPNSTGTATENPIVVDVDNDGHAEIVLARNDALGFGTQQGLTEFGIFVYGGKNNNWVRTRRIWNQHAYHITNVNEDGTIPKNEQPNWLTPGLNNFRTNAFAPGDDQADRFVYKATDGNLDSNEATVFITVHQPNNPPEIISTPLTTATVGLPYLHAVRAIDSDLGDELTFALIAAPAGMTIDPATGLLRWTPTSGQLGGNNVTVRVEDRGGLAAFQIFTIQVSTPVTVPNVVGQAQATAESTIGAAGLTVGVTSTASSTTVPAGQVISQNPVAGTSVAPGSGVNFVVSTGPPPPGLTLVSITVSPTDPSILTADTQAFTATGTFDDGSTQNLTDQVSWESTSTAVATITSAGVATGVAQGTTTIRASKDGVNGSTTLTVRTRIADSTPPTSTLTSPAPNSTITAPTDITGTATDANFSSYKLEIAPVGETTFTLLASGTAPSTGVLGTLDPSVLLNDLYTVRLTVFDLGGNATTSEVVVQVDGDLKVGNFSLTFTDLSIPLSGVSITVNRTYDSRDKRKGDFGVGWRLDVKTMQIRANRVQGTGWQVNKSGLSFVLVPADQHKVSLALPNGRAEEFDLVVTPTSSFLLPLQAVTASYAPRPGTLGMLVPLDNTNLVIFDNQPGPVELLDDLTFNPYDPQTFRYSSIDGQEFIINKTTGVQSVRDPNGNTLTFGPNGITHSAGKSVTFTRDAQGRITQLTDPMGRIQSYTYDANGDLVSHTDTGGNTTQFSYNGRHDLIKIVDPLGRPVSRNEYDESGRLIAVTDANGNRITFTHDLNARQEVVTDRLGRATVYSYDANGNILSATNPLGETTTFIYDSRNNKLSETDPLGQTTTFIYGVADNLTSTTDPLGNTITYTYDSRGQVLTVIDPLGHITTNIYDARGNLLAQTDPLGNTVSTTYDAGGNPLAITDPLGRTARNEYDGVGNRTKLTEATGNVITFSSDANGNLLSQANALSPAWNLAYDATNRTTSADLGGVMRRVEYDAAGQMTKVTGATGSEMRLVYDALGLPIQVVRSDGTTALSRTYDAERNFLTETDAVGNVTRHENDAADRLIATTFPDGSIERRGYDAAGQLVQVTNVLGHATRYAYDAAGRQIRSTDALGGITTREYDAAGNLTAQTDPLGHRTRYTYDAEDRLISTTFPDGSTEQQVYDGAGQLVQLVDPASHTTTFDYNAVQQLTSVTDALENITRYEYDSAGKRTAVVDANGNRTRFTYDTHGRLAGTIYPLGDSENATYDAAGRPTTTTNGNGETLQYTYNTQGLFSGLTLPGGGQESYTYTTDGLVSTVTDARGITTFAYDPTTRRQARVTEPDGRYGRYEYDAAGNRTFMAHAMSTGSPEEVTQYAYDALNRMVAVTDPSGGVTRYTYDAAGNRTAITRSNGTTTTLTYDDRNRLIQEVHRNASGTILASFIYTLDAVGNRTEVRQADNSRVEYDYDATYRVTAERHFDAGNTLTGSITYTYDAVGNLLSQSGSLGNATYAYNANNQLTAGDGLTYAYDGAGNLTSTTAGAGPATTYTHDARGRLVRFQPSVGAATTYTYDWRGIRQSKSGPGGTANFLIDRKNATGVAQVVRESNAAGATLRSYVYGPRLLAQTAGAATAYHHDDGLGSTRLLTDTTGAPTDTYTYSAYGELLARSGASPNAYLFAGEQQDAESGLYYLRARYYDPRGGRFLSRDPAAGNDQNPLSLHKYLYAHGNPVNLTDPSGLAIPTSLTELLTVLKTHFELRLRQAQNFQRTLERTTQGVARVVRFQSAFFTALATEGFFNSSLPSVLYFGSDPASRVTTGAGLVSLSFDIVWRQPEFVPPSLSPVCEPLVYAYVLLGGGAAAPNPPWPSRRAKVNICTYFFRLAFLPFTPHGLTASQGSMMGALVHEFTHVTLQTRVDIYGCAAAKANKLNPVAVSNPDNVRCFVEDSALTLGAEFLKQIL